MKNRIQLREIFLGLLFVTLLLLPNALQASDRANAAETSCSVVFTFSPALYEQQNFSEALFANIEQILNESPKSLTDSIENQGGKWSLSKNYSGIQLALIFAETTPEIASISANFFNKLERIIPQLPQWQPSNSLPASLIAVAPRAYQQQNHQSISIFISEPANDFLAEFILMTQSCNELLKNFANYNPQEKDIRHTVIPAQKAAVTAEISWNEISLNSFLSAKFVGSKFKKHMGDKFPCSYEIIFQPQQLKLLLVCQFEEKLLYHAYEPFTEFCKQPEIFTNHEEWPDFCTIAMKVIASDNRDLLKSLLKEAWLSHWGVDSFNQYNKPTYVEPADQQIRYIMPKLESHNLSLSGKTFPRIMAARRPANNNITDIVIKIITEKRVADEIENIFNSEFDLSFPVSLQRKAQQTITMSFHCRNNKVRSSVAAVRAKVLNSLALKNLINDLPSELSVSLAATSDLPPFILHGKLQQGWPSDPASYSWRPASAEDFQLIFSINRNAIDKEKILKRKWSLMMLSGKSQAEVMSELISRGLFIKTFDLF